MVAFTKTDGFINGLGNMPHPKYRPDIDGLRAIAVLSVVAFHAFPMWLPGGFIGVDIFFVISGFLISSIIFGGLDKGVFKFSVFYARRIKRIFPALILVLVSCLVFGWFALYPDEYKQLGKHVAGGSGFISNFILFYESGYFDTSAEIKPLLHLWSLGIEEQFYIIWPAVIWLVWRLRLNALIVTLAALAISMAWNVINIPNDPVAVFYMPYSRVWELLIGSVLAYANLYGRGLSASMLALDKIVSRVVFSKSQATPGATLKNLLSTAGSGMLGFGFYKITSATVFPGWWAMIPAMGAVMIIAAGPGAWINRVILSNKLFVWVGLISFPLYLWHWPLLSFARIIEGGTPAREIRIAAVVIAIVLAWLTYALIENPLKKINSFIKTALLIALMSAVGYAGYFIYSNEGMTERVAVKSSEEFNSQFTGPTWKFTQNRVCLDRYPMDKVNSYRWWFCMTNRDEAPTLMLLGSSFANHHYPGFANTDGLNKNTILSIGTCSIDVSTEDDPTAVAGVSPCSGNGPHEQRVFINGLIESNSSIKYAVIDGLRPDQDSVTIGRVESFIDFLKSKNIKPIIFAPHFLFEGRDLKGCFARPFKSVAESCDLDPGVRKSIDKGFAPLIESLKKSNPDVPVFDQNELFCNGGKCSPLLNGMPVFRDNASHYTEYASGEVAKAFAEWAKTHAPGILVQ